jgi:hypothetical protein
MKHIKLYESFTKSYGERITLDQFRELKPGQKVLYMGREYEIEDTDGSTLFLQSPSRGGSPMLVNYSMFNEKGAIRPEEETGLEVVNF